MDTGLVKYCFYLQGPRKSVSELKALDERELMYELVIDICNDLDVTSLCHKILQNVCLLVNADRCSLFLVQGEGESRYSFSQFVDVCVLVNVDNLNNSYLFFIPTAYDSKFEKYFGRRYSCSMNQ